MNKILSLSDLQKGDTGIVTDIRLDPDTENRLADIGIWRGARVTLLRAAPLGDPIEFCAGNCRIAMRKKEAAHIYIERVNGNSTK